MNNATGNQKLKRTARRLLLLSLAVLFLSIPLITTAQLGLEYGTDLNLGTRDLRVIVMGLIQIALGLVGLIFLVLIIFGGFTWMTSGGEGEKLEKAKKIIRNSVIGLVLILASLTIVTFVIRSLTDQWFQTPWGPSAPSGTYGLSALGNGIIDSHYPPPNEHDVPRNVNIIITFKEAISLCDLVMDTDTDTSDCDVDKDSKDNYIGDLNVDNLKIFERDAGESTAYTSEDKVTVTVNPNQKIFTFDPPVMGSSLEPTWYTVALSSDIAKEDGDAAFPGALGAYGYSWDFEVNTELDYTPPKIESVFPFPDNKVDDYQRQLAKYAHGSITVLQSDILYPQVAETASTSEVIPTGDAQNPPPDAHVEGAYTGEYQSDEVAIKINDPATTAAVTWIGQMSVNNNLLAPISGRQIQLGSGLTLVIDGDFLTGNRWTFKAYPEKEADTLVVYNHTFAFGEDIEVGDLAADTADSIIKAINGVSARVTAKTAEFEGSPMPNKVALTATMAGPAGDRIGVSSSSDALTIVRMTGGDAAVTSALVDGLPDQPRNVIVQINFNEAMMPQAVSGITEVDATGKDFSGFEGILVQYDYDGDGDFDELDDPDEDKRYAPGEWKISNQYKTIEFFSSAGCSSEEGETLKNSCGDPLSCLPLNKYCDPDEGCLEGKEATRFRIFVRAAFLETCSTEEPCEEEPYTRCTEYPVAGSSIEICQTRDDLNLPTADLEFDGVADVAKNSLDGNSNGNAQGPREQSGLETYDANAELQPNPGDDYLWSFFIHSDIDLTPPEITSTVPESGIGEVSLTQPVDMFFDKIMSSSTLRTGREELEDKVMEFLNLVDVGFSPVGYWITKANIDTDGDGYAEHTAASIRHTAFSKYSNYGARAGSGIRDIYQNCYKPSGGPACTGSQMTDLTRPSCCKGYRCAYRCLDVTGECPSVLGDKICDGVETCETDPEGCGECPE